MEKSIQYFFHLHTSAAFYKYLSLFKMLFFKPLCCSRGICKMNKLRRKCPVVFAGQYNFLPGIIFYQLNNGFVLLLAGCSKFHHTAEDQYFIITTHFCKIFYG